MVEVENVVHEDFQVTEEVKVSLWPAPEGSHGPRAPGEPLLPQFHTQVAPSTHSCFLFFLTLLL
jgi:hypothetical protein